MILKTRYHFSCNLELRLAKIKEEYNISHFFFLKKDTVLTLVLFFWYISSNNVKGVPFFRIFISVKKFSKYSSAPVCPSINLEKLHNMACFSQFGTDLDVLIEMQNNHSYEYCNIQDGLPVFPRSSKC